MPGRCDSRRLDDDQDRDGGREPDDHYSAVPHPAKARGRSARQAAQRARLDTVNGGQRDDEHKLGV